MGGFDISLLLRLFCSLGRETSMVALKGLYSARREHFRRHIRDKLLAYGGLHRSSQFRAFVL